MRVGRRGMKGTTGDSGAMRMERMEGQQGACRQGKTVALPAAQVVVVMALVAIVGGG